MSTQMIIIIGSSVWTMAVYRLGYYMGRRDDE